MSGADLPAQIERGIVQLRAGQHQQAMEIFTRVQQQAGRDAAVHFRLGECFEAIGDFGRADQAYGAAIEHDPELYQAYRRAADMALRARALAQRVGQNTTAEALRHGAFRYLASLGVRLVRRGAWEDAGAAFLKARALEPGNWAVHVDLGQCLYETRRPAAAEEAIREGIRLAPGEARAHYHLGIALMRYGRAGEAEAALRRAVAIDPSFVAASTALGDALRSQGSGEAADALYRAAAAAEPDAERGYYLMGPIYDETSPEQIYQRHRAWGDRAIAAAAPGVAAPFANSRDPGRRLRVGYVSPDFKTHSVAYFIEPLLACHDRDAVETFCYAEVAVPDEVTARLKRLAGHWRSTVAIDDETLRRHVREDGIDILIDLAGHSVGNRLSAFVVKPAPVTASWLGYPTTTGLATIDWRITDPVADPAGAESHHVERLMRLDGAFLCFRPPTDVPAVAALPAAATGRVTFGSFNNLIKMTPAVVALWAEILQAVPDSRLFLKTILLRDPAAQQRVREQFAARGVPASRLELRGGTTDMASHFAAYGEVDIGLDPFPYNGTATTCEALWLGVPVVSLVGERHSGRVGQSLLGRAGLHDLIQPDRRAYLDCAVRLAGDLAGLAARRAALRGQIAASPLCDGPGFAQAFEAGLRRMWTEWCGAASG